MGIKYISLMILFAIFSSAAFGADSVGAYEYPIALDKYPTCPDLFQTLIERIKFAPFNLFATVMFVGAIIHTFCFRSFLKLSEKFKILARVSKDKYAHRQFVFFEKTCHLLGEVEAIFALWLVPLLAGFWFVYGWDAFTGYLDTLTFVDKKYVEPAFVVAVMCIASTRPIIQISEDIVSIFARLGKKSVAAWWISILTVGPLLGSFITEPAAITICATLLGEKFFRHNPSSTFKYATIGLLFVAISSGGTLTHFSAPPVLMVASEWGWGLSFMFFNFGWKAAVGIILSIALYLIIFGKEFSSIEKVSRLYAENNTHRERIPMWIVAIHIGYLVFIVYALHHPALFLFLFLLFLSFVEATQKYQSRMKLKMPLLVGVFLAALITHGTLQAWWIDPVLKSLDGNQVFFGSIILTAFNDNAAITYLATLVPDFSDSMKYLVVAGAVAGGGLTVIANAPNPAGASLLSGYFFGGISPWKLFLGAAIPTVIVSLMFYIF